MQKPNWEHMIRRERKSKPNDAPPKAMMMVISIVATFLVFAALAGLGSLILFGILNCHA